MLLLGPGRPQKTRKILGQQNRGRGGIFVKHMNWIFLWPKNLAIAIRAVLQAKVGASCNDTPLRVQRASLQGW